MVVLDNISKTYPVNGGIQAVSTICLSLAAGDSLTLVGPSGCGKSTLLLLLAGLEQPTAGRVLFDGVPVREHRREIALVLQDYGLFPWKTVRRNVELGLRIRRERFTPKLIETTLSGLDIGEKIDVYPQQLSGGQKQRVALARAMILHPRLLLLDEPFAALDTLTRERLQDLLLETWHSRGFGMIIATHNVQEAVMLGRRIAVMGGKPGRLMTIIDNPDCGETDYRSSDEFNLLARQVRKALERLL